MLAEALHAELYRVLVPFQDLTTTVYAVLRSEGVTLIDSATYPEDVDAYILPALAELGVLPSQVTTLALTHRHGDHAGGIARLSACFPQATVRAMAPIALDTYRPLTDGEQLPGGLQALHLPGHTADSMGYFDTRTHTLLSGDCLQLRGVGRYRNGVSDPAQYVRSVERLRAMPIECIVAAHEYDPLGSIARGRAAVLAYLDACIQAIQPNG